MVTYRTNFWRLSETVRWFPMALSHSFALLPEVERGNVRGRVRVEYVERIR